MAADGSGVEPVVETWSGQRLNSPNDIVCRSDGLIYFTDPPYGVEPARARAPLPGRLRARPRPERAATRLRLLADDFEKPNGLAFSPDERTLYVCDTGALSRPGLRGRAVGLAAASARAASSPGSTPVSPAVPTG